MPNKQPRRQATQVLALFEQLQCGLFEKVFVACQRADPVPDFHSHPGEQIILALEGQSLLEIKRPSSPNTSVERVHEGDVAMLPPNFSHRWITRHGELRVWAINLCAPEDEARRRLPHREDFERTIALLMGGGEAGVISRLASGDEIVRSLVGEYCAEANLDRPGMRLRLGALSMEVLVRLARLRMQSLPDSLKPGLPPSPESRLAPRHYVERARELLHASYRQPMRLPEIADRVGLSVSHLHRLFVAQTKTAPMAYLRRYRLYRATEMLRANERSINQIAAEVGFPTAQRFAKAFQRQYGLAPREYRKVTLQEGAAQL